MKLEIYLSVFLLLAMNHGSLCVSIEDFGAIPNDNTFGTAFQNSDAIQKAFQAISEMKNEERIVIIPEGKAYHFFPVQIQNLSNFTFQIDGKLILPENSFDVWPKDGNNYRHALYMINCSYFKITGNGLIDGQGYDWWWGTLTTKVGSNRPDLFYIDQSSYFEIENIRVKDSPRYHFALHDVIYVTIRGVDIKVDVRGQRELVEKYNKLRESQYSLQDRIINWLKPIPMFPFNTDGIDPWGSNIYISNVTIENYDDAVAVKPCNKGYKLSLCSENILVENSRVKYGVGMTIGSVPPNNQFACVRNVTFRNIQFEKPFKAIYVKTNPGEHGYGVIEKITYENIAISEPIWWGIYIGPQQQKQPDGGGPGCMLYPLNKDCQTQPRVPIKDITLRNITSTKGWLSPGILRCNETAPCTGWVFEDVNIQGWASFWGWYCENIFGTIKNVFPDPGCFGKNESNPKQNQKILSKEK